MLKRINIFILFIIFLFIMSFDIKASSEDLYNDLFSGFSIISGNRDISSELIYKIRYTALDITDEDINGEINYQYEILGDNNFNGSINVLYKIENSLGVELKVSIGDVIIYDLVLNDYASIDVCEYFDFTQYSNQILYVDSYTYNVNFLSGSSNAIALAFYENTKLDYLLGIKANKGKVKYFTFSNNDAKSIDELYYDIEKQYDVITNNIILESNYSPITNYVEPGTYKVKILSVDAYDEIHLDIINILAVNSDNYFYCDYISANFDDPITDEMIYKYYVHYYDKSNIKSYKINSDYKYNANIEGIYDYQVIILDNDNNELSCSGKIEVGDFTKPLLTINYDGMGDGSYKTIKEIFYYKAYDNKDLDITSKIKIKDLDDYEHNYEREGTYRFLFSVEDDNKNESTKIVEYKVYIKKEEVIEEPKEENEEESKEEVNEEIKEDKKENINPTQIKYEFYTDNQTPLTREMIRQKLIFSGFYKETDNISITSEYFDNKDKNGTYILYVNMNDNTECYSITVKEKEVILDESEEEEGFNYNYVILGSVIGVLLIGGLSFVIIKKIKKKK